MKTKFIGLLFLLLCQPVFAEKLYPNIKVIPADRESSVTLLRDSTLSFTTRKGISEIFLAHGTYSAKISLSLPWIALTVPGGKELPVNLDSSGLIVDTKEIRKERQLVIFKSGQNDCFATVDYVGNGNILDKSGNVVATYELIPVKSGVGFACPIPTTEPLLNASETSQLPVLEYFGMALKNQGINVTNLRTGDTAFGVYPSLVKENIGEGHNLLPLPVRRIESIAFDSKDVHYLCGAESFGDYALAGNELILQKIHVAIGECRTSITTTKPFLRLSTF